MKNYWILAASALVFTPLALAEEDLALYADIDGWEIYVDPSLNNGCFAIAEYEDDTVFRIGIDNTDGTFYAMVGDPSWKSIEYDKDYEVTFQFSEESEWEWTATATGMSFDPPENQPYLWIPIDSDENLSVDFLKEFMEESSFDLFYLDKNIISLELTSSYKASIKLLECQEAENAKEVALDPFTDTTEGSDPFET